MIPRFKESQLMEDMFQGKAIVLTGPRQVGKTTLLDMIKSRSHVKTLWLNCDEPDIRMQLENANSTQLKELAGEYSLIFIDEAQRVKNIGITLKLMVDNLKNVQIVATGSSALELANEISEPLTGRKWEYRLFPMSALEMVRHHGRLEESRLLEQRLIYGSYPDIINHPTKAKRSLLELSNNYLYKDLLALENIRKPVLLEKILTALALQLGNEVSFVELSRRVGADHKTVEHYIQMLEKSFVIFQLPAFSRNLRNEIKKGRKIYFYDNGIRNAIIKNFNPVGMRQDIGALWENHLIGERIKLNAYTQRFVNSYFWRTHAQQEIDYIEESSGQLLAVEFKWNEQGRKKWPDAFEKAYPNTTYTLINRTNYMDFIVG
ncbi:MAG: ATP-binding protein [Chitinophagaceae bacterium]